MNWKDFRLAARIASACTAVAALLALSTPPAFAQTTGQITGTIVDAQGGVLPGVTVTASSPQLQGVRTAVSDSTGTFRIPTLPPGTYAVKVTLSGFQDITQENIAVSLDKTANLSLKMQLAGVATSVNVSAQAPAIDISTSSGGVTVDQAMINRFVEPRGWDILGEPRVNVLALNLALDGARP